jgi:hypothetical protein
MERQSTKHNLPSAAGSTRRASPWTSQSGEWQMVREQQLAHACMGAMGGHYREGQARRSTSQSAQEPHCPPAPPGRDCKGPGSGNALPIPNPGCKPAPPAAPPGKDPPAASPSPDPIAPGPDTAGGGTQGLVRSACACASVRRAARMLGPRVSRSHATALPAAVSVRGAPHERSRNRGRRNGSKCLLSSCLPAG